MRSVEVDDSKVVKVVHVSSKTASIIEDISVGFDTLIVEEGYASYDGASEVVNVLVDFDTPLNVDTHAHDISESVPELEEFSVYSQIFRYLIVTPLIEDDIEHEIVNSSIVTFSGPSESPRVDFDFMVVPIDSFTSESPDSLP